MLLRRQLLGSLAWGAGALALSAHAAEPDSVLARGTAWLLAQQADDGGWHSEFYGALRAGAATTALAMYTLCHLPQKYEEQKVTRALERGLKFLSPGIKKRGFVACPDGSLDYPTYGTAMIATAAQMRDFGLSQELRDKFIDWVVGGQLHESREFTTNSPHYGGWDLMGASQVIGQTSDTTVSCSCYALEAIHRGKSAEVKRTLERARAWTERCQDLRGDGGFWFSPDPMSINHKAGWHDDEQTAPKAYASATADGLRCLRYTSTDGGKDRQIEAAEKYLADQTEVAHVPGFADPEDPNGWALGLRFYYYQSLAKAIAPVTADWATKRREAIRKQLKKSQQKDGRWQNESGRMREDDPLIATSLALTAAAVLE
jgi:hypothetical protein